MGQELAECRFGAGLSVEEWFLFFAWTLIRFEDLEGGYLGEDLDDGLVEGYKASLDTLEGGDAGEEFGAGRDY
jgi:hypothetical protein